MHQTENQIVHSGANTAPLRSVRVGRSVVSARWPGRLEALRTTSKKLAWTAVEARLVTTPVRYTIRQLTTRRRGDYTLRKGGGRFSVRHRSGDIDILRKFYAYRYYDPPEPVITPLRELERAVRVLDLGANIGFFDVFIRDYLSIGRVVCFEPDPSNAAVLDHVRSANCANWEIVRACAANRNGKVRFTTGQKNFSRIGDGGDTEIATVDVFPYIVDADLVKMNIEGSEWDILHDPRLADTSATWIVEYHRIANPEPDIHGLIKDLFQRAGYTVQQATVGDENGLLWAWRP